MTESMLVGTQMDLVPHVTAKITEDEPPEVCPTCGAHRPVIYERKLNSSMARALVEIAFFFKRHPSESSIHAISYLVGLNLDPRVKAGLTGGVHSKLVYWGLLEEAVDMGRGYYRVTSRGWKFLRGEIVVSRGVSICGGKVVGETSETTTLQQALVDSFDLDELLDLRR